MNAQIPSVHPLISKSFLSFCCAVSLTTVLTMLGCSSEPKVEEAGGATSVSPNGRLEVERYDGFSQFNQKRYAILYLWDLQHDPTMKAKRGKHPELKLTFPQSFDVRAADSQVNWEKNSTEFSIKYRIVRDSPVEQGRVVLGGSATPGRMDVQNVRLLKYNIESNLFSLSEADVPVEQPQ